MDRLLGSRPFADVVGRWPRDRVVGVLREVLDRVRGGRVEVADMEDETWYAARVRSWLEAGDRPSLLRVINATGVVLHTNLGRAPLAAAAREAMARAGEGYSNLEFDLGRGERGSRYDHCADLIEELLEAEAALVVNNCAAGLVLAMNALSGGGRVLVSRGELVEIGGGFRIPEMLDRAGARLVEVGSTNRTRVEDYEAAFREGGAAVILKVHRSNFRIAGFTEEASLPELSDLARGWKIPLVHDLGSGLLVSPGRLGLPDEPRPTDSLAAGADLVSFSGDKLLGGPQAGILAGRKEIVRRCRASPLCRAFRVDKVTLAGLEATLQLYRRGEEAAVAAIPALRALAEPVEDVRERADRLLAGLVEAGVPARVAEGRALVGGGTCPGVEIPSWTVRVGPVDEGAASRLAAALRSTEASSHPDPTAGVDPAPEPRVPVVARTEAGEVVLDLRTVTDGEVASVTRTVAAAWAEEASP